MPQHPILSLASPASLALHGSPISICNPSPDLGSNDVGFRQNKAWAGNPRGLPTASAASGLFATPNLDQLVREGVSLSSHYTQPLCSPTRAALLTGRLSIHQRIGPDVIEISDPYGLPAAETLLPALLKRKANYSTHAIGKVRG